MSWNQLTVDVPDDLIDAVVGELSGHGVDGVWESHSPEPGTTRLILYFSFRSNLEQIEAEVREVFLRSGLQSPPVSRTIVEECDWTEQWKASYKSFTIGDDFFVIPSWETALVPDERLAIRIDPGQAFGTGTHETTQLMIEAIERWLEPRHVILDLGTGSGILAIATALRGATKVFACDIDAVALQIARANIERNSESRIWTFCGSLDAVRTDSIDLMMGNLTADLIVSLMPDLRRVLKPHAIAILSGILHDQIEEIRESLSRFHFTIYEERTRGEWMAVVGEKHVG